MSILEGGVKGMGAALAFGEKKGLGRGFTLAGVAKAESCSAAVVSSSCTAADSIIAIDDDVSST